MKELEKALVVVTGKPEARETHTRRKAVSLLSTLYEGFVPVENVVASGLLESTGAAALLGAKSMSMDDKNYELTHIEELDEETAKDIMENLKRGTPVTLAVYYSRPITVEDKEGMKVAAVDIVGGHLTITPRQDEGKVFYSYEFQPQKVWTVVYDIKALPSTERIDLEEIAEELGVGTEETEEETGEEVSIEELKRREEEPTEEEREEEEETIADLAARLIEEGLPIRELLRREIQKMFRKVK